MSDQGERAGFSFNSDLSHEAEITAIELAAVVSDVIETLGHVLGTDDRRIVEDILAPGLAHFYDLASQAGELANQGDIIGAFSVMGGEANARDLIGDETVDELLTELSGQTDQSIPDRFE